jgi:hypothetical protein
MRVFVRTIAGTLGEHAVAFAIREIEPGRMVAQVPYQRQKTSIWDARMSTMMVKPIMAGHERTADR